MTFLRHVVGNFFLAGTLLTGVAVEMERAAAAETVPLPAENKPAGSAETNNPNLTPFEYGYQGGGGNTKPGIADSKQVLALKESLKSMRARPFGSPKAEDDFFVIGTLDVRNHQGTVEFVIKAGLQAAAEYIAEFEKGKGPGIVHEWRAVDRVKSLKTAEAAVEKAKAESIEGKLSALNLSGPGEKTPNDFFVVGTAELNPETKHADIRYEVLGGVKKTSDFVLDFIYSRPSDRKGDWHVFIRTSAELPALEFRKQLRDLYDAQEAQRAKIAALYKVRTTIRC